MDNKRLYCQKDGGILELKNINNSYKDYTIDYLNDIIIQSYIDKDKVDNIIIVFTQFINDMFNPQYIKCENIIYKTKNINMDYEDVNRKKSFTNMRLCYKEEMNSCANVTNYMLVFCSNDMKSSNVKKEINNILDRKQREEEYQKLNLSINNISESIKYFSMFNDPNSLEFIKLFNEFVEENKDELKNIKNSNGNIDQETPTYISGE